MKEVLAAAGVPTAAHRAFGPAEVEAAVAFLDELPGLYVVKTDGLAAGKGVLVTESMSEAEDDVRAKLSGRAFGDAGRRVVIEEGMSGPEVSLLCLCDGAAVSPMASAQDFKRLADGDRGPNTGGMGAHSPAAVDSAEGAVGGGARGPRSTSCAGGHRLRGVLYAGLMLTPEAQGARVQRALRRPGGPGRCCAVTADLADVLVSVAAGAMEAGPTFATTPRSPSVSRHRPPRAAGR
jgi:phosphoribosylamine--glycine ligase